MLDPGARARVVKEAVLSDPVARLESELGVSLRPWQSEVIRKICEFLSTVSRGEQGIVIALNMPTGCGKTLIALAVGYLHRQDHYTLYFVRTRTQLARVCQDCLKFFKLLPGIALAKTASCPELRDAEDELALPCRECERARELDVADARKILELALSENICDPYKLAEVVSRRMAICPYSCFRQLGNKLGSPWMLYTYPYLLNTRLRELISRDVGVVVEAPPEYVKSRKVKLLAVVDEAHNLEYTLLHPEVSIGPATASNALEEIDTYARLVLDRVRGGGSGSEGEPQLIQIGEAVIMLEDAGEDSAESSDELTESDIEAFREVARVVDKKVRELHRKLGDEEEKIVENFYDDVEAVIKRFGYESFTDFFLKARTFVKHVYEIQREQGMRPRSSLNALVKFLAALRSARGRSDVVVVYNAGDLEIRRTDPTVLYKDYLSVFNTVILMSGTLPSKEYLISVWGVPEDKLLYLDMSNIRIGQVTKYVCREVTSRYSERTEEMFRKYAKIIAHVYRKADRSVLVLTPCYKFAEKIYEYLDEDTKANTIVEARKMRLSDVEELVKTGKKLIIAVASGKLCEGIEFTDEQGRSLISDVVIAGIPYPRPTEYWEQVEKKILEKTGLGDVWFLRNEQAYIKIRQALGRAVRHPEDKCRWWLLDYRFVEGRGSEFWIAKLDLRDYVLVQLRRSSC